MTMDWNEMQLFLAVAEGGSVTAAAKKLKITQPTASRRLLDLEASIGEPLFVRGTSGAHLTSFGERMLEPARRMAEWAGETERVAARAQTKPAGVVRITAAPGVAYDFVAPFAAHARKKLPDVTLEVISTVQYLDLGRREADLALRFQPPSGRDVVSVAKIEFDVALYGSAKYVATLPKKPTMTDIAWIAWAPPLDHLSPNPELASLIPNFRPSFASDDFVVQQRAAEEGLGAIFLGKITHRFSKSALVEIPLPMKVPRNVLHLACARSALDVPRVRAVAELLARELETAVR
jgi:DNA-binding transcriptional LysR family regulator